MRAERHLALESELPSRLAMIILIGILRPIATLQATARNLSYTQHSNIVRSK